VATRESRNQEVWGVEGSGDGAVMVKYASTGYWRVPVGSQEAAEPRRKRKRTRSEEPEVLDLAGMQRYIEERDREGSPVPPLVREMSTPPSLQEEEQSFKRLAAPVTLEFDEGLQTYLDALEKESESSSLKEGEEPAKKKLKKQHRRFTSPVTKDVEEGLQRYLAALEREGKSAPKIPRAPSAPPIPINHLAEKEEPHPTPINHLGNEEAPTSTPLPPKSPRPQSKSLEITATAAAALASTQGLLIDRAGAATPPQRQTLPTSPDSLIKPLMPPPPTIPSHNTYTSKITAWKLSPNDRALSYLLSNPTNPSSPPQ
jgi:hypothetical protein